MAAHRKRMYAGDTDYLGGGNGAGGGGAGNGGTFFSNISSTATNALVAMNKVATLGSRTSSSATSSFYRSGPGASIGAGTAPPAADADLPLELPLDQVLSSPALVPRRKRARVGSEDADVPPLGAESHPGAADEHSNAPPPLPTALDPLPSPDSAAARQRQAILLDLFSADADPDPDVLAAVASLSGPELDTPLDKSANTAVHWAATLGRVGLVSLLIGRGSDMYRGNIAGHTPLMAAVAVSNCLDHGCFPDLVELLGPLIEVQDRQGRTILHHIVVASGIRGRERSSRYYLEVLLEFLVRSLGQPASGGVPSRHARVDLMRFLGQIVNAQDKAGNTALHLAARIGNAGIVQQLLEVLADPHVPNFNGLRPSDFGIPGHEPDPSRVALTESGGAVHPGHADPGAGRDNDGVESVARAVSTGECA